AALANKNASKEDKLQALNAITLVKTTGSLEVVVNVLFDEKDVEVRVAAASTLATFDGAQIPQTYLARWKDFPPAVRTEILTGLKGRRDWAHILFDYVEMGVIPPTDVNNTTILALRNFKDAKLNQRIVQLWGTVRESPKDLEELIAKMRGFMSEGHGD